MEYVPFTTTQLEAKQRASRIDAFTRAYLECAEWCGVDDEAREALELSVRPRWSEESIDKASAECAAFREECRIALESSGLSDERAGHDFWLTRNRHGAGFWDEGLGGCGEFLTKAAHRFGEAYVSYDADSEVLILEG